MTEIRWHGRGGQGAKSVAELLAAAMLHAGHFVQSFPEYGPERSGAPLQAYTRISTRPIRIHSGVTEPDSVVVLDESLLGEVDVTNGLAEEGLLLINTPAAREEIAERLGHTGPVVCLDAGRLAAEAGAKHGNVVMVGALAALGQEPELDDLRWALDEIFGHKLSAVVQAANLRALELGYRAVSSSMTGVTPAGAGEERSNDGN